MAKLIGKIFVSKAILKEAVMGFCLLPTFLTFEKYTLVWSYSPTTLLVHTCFCTRIGFQEISLYGIVTKKVNIFINKIIYI